MRRAEYRRLEEIRKDMLGGDISEVFKRGTGSALILRRMNENEWRPNVVSDVRVWVRSVSLSPCKEGRWGLVSFSRSEVRSHLACPGCV